MEYKPNVRALLELSGCKDIQLAGHMEEVVKSAADPEMATRHMLELMNVQSEVLQDKWRKHIGALWALVHPGVPKALLLPLTSTEVAFAPVLVEVHTLMQELHDNPVRIHEDPKDHFLSPAIEARLASEIPLFNADSLHVRRVCALLEELRLIRPYKGYVRIVASKYREFQALPLPSQYYLLWHADMYHLDWKEYFHEWGAHLVVFQQYLPMVWESLSHMQAGDSESVDEFTAHLVRSFRVLWQQELAFGLYEQSALQEMVEVWLIGKVFVRYGFSASHASRTFEFTSLGQKMLEMERTTNLPCSTDVLS